MKLFQKHFVGFPHDSPHESYLLAFWNFKFKLKKKRLKISLTQDRVGMKTSKPYSSYSSEASSTKLFQNVPYDSPHKRYLLGSWKFKFKLLKMEFNLWSMGRNAHVT